MPPEFSNRFLDTTYYHNQFAFSDSLFRGFYFVAKEVNNGGAISYFNIGDSTRMELHYHNNKDTSTYLYNINSSSYRCNIFERTINPDIKPIPAKTPPDGYEQEELFYIKHNNVFEGRIDITGLQSWADTLDYFTINKAILTIYAEQPVTPTDSLYYPLYPLNAYRVNDEFEKIYLEEYYTTTYNGIGYDTISGGYQININKTLYKTIQNGDSTLSLILATDKQTNISFANRFILKGGGNTEKPILKVTYTKLNIK